MDRPCRMEDPWPWSGHGHGVTIVTLCHLLWIGFPICYPFLENGEQYGAHPQGSLDLCKMYVPPSEDHLSFARWMSVLKVGFV